VELSRFLGFSRVKIVRQSPCRTKRLALDLEFDVALQDQGDLVHVVHEVGPDPAWWIHPRWQEKPRSRHARSMASRPGALVGLPVAARSPRSGSELYPASLRIVICSGGQPINPAESPRNASELAPHERLEDTGSSVAVRIIARLTPPRSGGRRGSLPSHMGNGRFQNNWDRLRPLVDSPDRDRRDPMAQHRLAHLAALDPWTGVSIAVPPGGIRQARLLLEAKCH
jgi:hypothetical protein